MAVQTAEDRWTQRGVVYQSTWLTDTKHYGYQAHGLVNLSYMHILLMVLSKFIRLGFHQVGRGLSIKW